MPKVTISGSYHKHLGRILERRAEFISRGAEVLRPHTSEILTQTEVLVRLQGDPDDSRLVQKAQLEAIRECDLLYVVNPGGYVGAAACGEIGYAHAMGKLVVTMEPAFERWVADITDAVGNIEKALTVLKEHND